MDKKKQLWDNLNKIIELDLVSEAISILGTLNSISNKNIVPGQVNYKPEASLAELVEGLEFENNQDLILVTAFYLYQKTRSKKFTTREINRELSQINRKPANTTRDISILLGSRDKLVIQISRSGSTQQGRREFKVTDNGIAAAKQSLQR